MECKVTVTFVFEFEAGSLDWAEQVVKNNSFLTNVVHPETGVMVEPEYTAEEVKA